MMMLLRYIHWIDERARAAGITIADNAFIFSLEPDCSRPMPADYATRRVAELREHLGIADKKPETVTREDEALRLFRQPPPERRPGRTGPLPKGGMPYEEIGRRLGRSEKWAMLAVASAKRREAAAARGEVGFFDGSILGLRKFTSTELMDSGFNMSAVAERQGHSPQVLAKHYSKGRRSADRKAAAHLGRLVHRDISAAAEPEGPGLMG
jgi:hypothetical protein